MSSRITVDLSDEESDALGQAVSEGRFNSVEEALKAGIPRVAPAAHRRAIADAYRSGYARFPQDPFLGEAGAELLVEAVELDARRA